MNKQLDSFDIQAEREGSAIRRHNDICPKNHQIKKLYFVDDEPFPTNYKKRRVGRLY